MKTKDQLNLEKIYEKVLTEAYSDSEFDDDLNVGSSNMPHGMGHPDRSDKGDDWTKVANLNSFVDDYEAELSFPAFVTAYDHTRAYGGPEEGGWWYDAYEPLESITVNSSEEAEQAAQKLYNDFHGSTDGKLSIDIERQKGSQVKDRPHYE